MITKSRGRFGVSKELEGSDPGRGRSGGRGQKWVKRHWISGLGRGRVGSCLGRGRVEVASRSSPGRSRVCARISSMSILQCVSSGGGKQPTIKQAVSPILDGKCVHHLQGCAVHPCGPSTVLHVVSSSSAMLSTVQTVLTVDHRFFSSP